MKSKDVLKILKISRITLMNYLKSGKIKATKLDNGYYDYDDQSIFKFLKKDKRINVTGKVKKTRHRSIQSTIFFIFIIEYKNKWNIKGI